MVISNMLNLGCCDNLPVTDNTCISQQLKDSQQLQSEQIPPLSALFVLN